MSISDHYDSNVDGLNVNGRKTGSKYHLICWMFPYEISKRLSGLLSIHFYLNIIVKNSHCSRTLFSTIDSVINPSVKSSSVISSLECEKCIHFFSNKINTTRAQVYLDITFIRSLFLLFTVERNQHLKDWKPVCKKSKCGSQLGLGIENRVRF